MDQVIENRGELLVLHLSRIPSRLLAGKQQPVRLLTGHNQPECKRVIFVVNEDQLVTSSFFFHVMTSFDDLKEISLDGMRSESTEREFDRAVKRYTNYLLYKMVDFKKEEKLS